MGGGNSKQKQKKKKGGTKKGGKPDRPLTEVEVINGHGYDLGKRLGKGNFAVVKRVIRRSDRAELAVKIIAKKRLKPKELVMIERELEIMGEMSHKNIVQMEESFVTPGHLYLVLELLEGGELFDAIVKDNRGFSEKVCAKCVNDIASACSYMHSKGIIHRDLKPENLIYADKAHSRLVVTDFGLASSRMHSKDDPMMTACGTPGYVAPEILRQNGYEQECDLWSIGVVLYILLCGFPPFHSENIRDLYGLIKRGDYSFPSPYWDNISDQAKTTVQRLLTVDPKKRITAPELLELPWVKDPDAAAANTINPYAHVELRKLQIRRKLMKAVRAVLAINEITRCLTMDGSAMTREESQRVYRASQRDSTISAGLRSMGVTPGDLSNFDSPRASDADIQRALSKQGGDVGTE